MHILIFRIFVFYIINSPMTARVKISKNVDILAKVYVVHLKVKHCVKPYV